MIRALRVGTIGARYRGARPGRLFALLPEPVDGNECLAAAGFTAFADSDDEWDREFDRLVVGLVRALERRFGEPSVVAPPRRQSWMTRLARLGSRPKDTTNPDKLTPEAALTSAVRDDSYLEFAAVELGRSAAPPGLAMAFTSGGHPIVWVWLDDSVAAQWSDLVGTVVGDLPRSDLDIAWESLIPAKPVLSIELPRARLHRGDSASWTDGARSLGFHAGLGVHPHEVYLPSEAAWATTSPAWAATLRDVIVRDFEQMGVRVVERPNATVHDGHPEAISE
jgi:hypothetical protein